MVLRARVCGEYGTVDGRYWRGVYKGSCMHFSLYVYYQCRQILEDRTVGTYNTRKRKKTVHTLLIENPKERGLCFLQLMQCKRVLFEKLIVRHPVRKFPAFYGTWRFITAFTRARYLSLSWDRSIHSVSSILYILRVIAVHFTLKQATKIQKGSRCITLLYLEDTFWYYLPVCS